MVIQSEGRVATRRDHGHDHVNYNRAVRVFLEANEKASEMVPGSMQALIDAEYLVREAYRALCSSGDNHDHPKPHHGR